ncbi:MAG: SMI1/KNR4 family protein, partial [Bradymonadaceae bacterium]
MSTYKRRVAEVVETLEEETFHREGGAAMKLSFAPPADEAVLEAFEQKVGHPLPDEFVDLAQVTRGFEGNEVLFEGMRLPETHEAARLEGPRWGLENLVRFGHDGRGNYMFVELTETGAPVWFLC